jgi:DNA-binding CsgD family transcriptional regulator/PAS domain-containing protein
MVAANIEQWPLERFKQDYSTVDRNPLLIPAMTALEGRALYLPEVVGEDRYDNSAIYNDVLRPLGVRNYLNAVALRSGSLFVGFLVNGGPHKERPAEKEIRLFESATRHIGRAFRLSGTLGSTSTRLKGLEATLDCLKTGVFLVDRAGRVSWHNNAAAELLERRDGLTLKAGRLAGANPTDDRALTTALAGAADATIHIRRPSGGRALILSVHRLWPSLASSAASCAIFVRDPDSDHLSAAKIAGTFGLTEAEARAAIAVSQSHGVADAASALGLSPNTVKTTLQRVFAKTGTHSQAELVRLLVYSLGHTRSGQNGVG